MEAKDEKKKKKRRLRKRKKKQNNRASILILWRIFERETIMYISPLRFLRRPGCGWGLVREEPFVHLLGYVHTYTKTGGRGMV